jgi:protocatechuate 3,4-dioxygenase beta subunit
MDRDDTPVGYLLSRREAIALMGAAGVAAVSGSSLPDGSTRLLAAAPSCVVRPEQLEGPYFVDEQLNRSDIRSDPASGAERDGVRLDLAFQVFRIDPGGCQPLAGATVDVWQCDALGVYSDVRDIGGRFRTQGQKFLRGFQVTDQRGGAEFISIFPGWYEGRAVHVHFKIRTTTAGGGAHEFTSQLYFEDALTADILARQPYATRGDRWPRNSQDRFFRDGGEQLTLAVNRTKESLSTTFGIGLQLG